MDDAEFQAFADGLAEHVKRCLDERNIEVRTVPVGVPRGVENAALGRAGDLVLRCVVDWDTFASQLMLRIDVLMEWDG